MSPSSTPGRVASVVLTAVLTLAASLLAATPAQAANRVTPGSFTGYGFDQCVAPTQAKMDAWLTSSPYWAVGIYIAGDNRYCGDDLQVNLDSTWVASQLRKGWRLLPITVGRQASCSSVARYEDRRISADPTRSYAKAREQGRIEARDTVRAARALGITVGSTLWYDLEHFTGGDRCRDSALSFLSAWTVKLHALGYRSGVYSSGSSGIRALDDARVLSPRRYAMPDQVWVAEWNGRADVSSSYLRPDGWMPHARVHQYRGDHTERYGGVSITIDSNYLDLGRGSVAPREGRHCGGVDVSKSHYRRLVRGDQGAMVKVVQCLLREKRLYRGDLRFTYTRKTARAVKRFQATRSLPVNSRTNARTWTALLAEGPAPLVKVGSASHAVRRAQRALNAATSARLDVTGLFDAATTRAVRTYQRDRGLRATGVLAADTWSQLKRGLS
ncbi:MAG TPA: glycoside hydrolase domain-containing protein [Nocardioidaceae bacterium]|nr:glycoside hydrolase domain-containing protein [Nocardioidaceae bacterium]